MNLANILTVSRIIITPVFAYFFLQSELSSKVGAVVLFFMASITDWYDGYWARRRNVITRFGQFLDPVADKILVSTALALFAWLDYVYLWMIIVIIARDALITTLRMFALYRGKVIITSVFAKWKTFVQMIFVFLLLIYICIPGLPDITLHYTYKDYFLWTTILALVVVLLTIASGIHYLIYNRSHLIELFRRLSRLWS